VARRDVDDVSTPKKAFVDPRLFLAVGVLRASRGCSGCASGSETLVNFQIVTSIALSCKAIKKRYRQSMGMMKANHIGVYFMAVRPCSLVWRKHVRLP
jgi:hypothetical protein